MNVYHVKFIGPAVEWDHIILAESADEAGKTAYATLSEPGMYSKHKVILVCRDVAKDYEKLITSALMDEYASSLE